MNSPQSRLTVLVCHPDTLLALGLTAALREQHGIDVYVHGKEPAALAPQIVITDGRRGVDPSAAGFGARILVVARDAREQDIRSALERGVFGYVLQNCSAQELAEGVRTLGRGSRYLCQDVALQLASSVGREALSPREQEVLVHLSCGACNKSIARQLDIAVGTVKSHVKSLMAKLGADNRTQVVTIAAERGLIGGLSQLTPSAYPIAWSNGAVGMAMAA